MPVLFLHYPDKKKRWTREVLKDRFTIGRSRDAEVCIPHTSVSKQHVLVEKRSGRFVYRDLGSTNGIYLNEFRKDQGTLEDGDELRVGSIFIKFYGEKPPPRVKDPEPTAAVTESGVAKPLQVTVQAPPQEHFEDLDELPVDLTKTIVALPVESQPAAIAGIPARRIPAGRSYLLVHEAQPIAGGARRWRTRTLALTSAGCLLSGIVLGYLAGHLHWGPPAPGAGERSAHDSEARSSPAAQAPALTGALRDAPDEPLGPPADLLDAESMTRLCVRLYIDLRGRPPTRDEIRGLASLPHDKLWYVIASKASPPFEPPPDKLPEAFERLMGRQPTPEEHASLLKLAKGDPVYYPFFVGTSRDYASKTHRRKRKPEDLARSLLVDLNGATPTKEQEKKAVAAVLLPQGDVAAIAKSILDPAVPSQAGPREGETMEAWVKDAYARLLLRSPTDEEKRAGIAFLAREKEGWRAVLLDLASRPEYLEY